MPVNTARVAGRRKLRFVSMDDMVADADRLAAEPNVAMLGNWSLGELLAHLTMAIDKSIDGFPAQAPWYIRVVGRAAKGWILNRGFSPGFNLPKSIEAEFFPAASSPQDAFEGLVRAVGRLRTESMSARHPVLGKLTHHEWTLLHLRHAEMHLSFAIQGT